MYFSQFYYQGVFYQHHDVIFISCIIDRHKYATLIPFNIRFMILKYFTRHDQMLTMDTLFLPMVYSFRRAYKKVVFVDIKKFHQIMLRQWRQKILGTEVLIVSSKIQIYFENIFIIINVYFFAASLTVAIKLWHLNTKALARLYLFFACGPAPTLYCPLSFAFNTI